MQDLGHRRCNNQRNKLEIIIQLTQSDNKLHLEITLQKIVFKTEGNKKTIAKIFPERQKNSASENGVRK